MSAYDVFLADCPARTTLRIIGNTWTSVVIVALSERPMRYTDLQTRIGGVSKKMLTQTLRTLQFNGLVRRGAGSSAHYELTDLGRSLLGPIQALVDWAEAHVAEVADTPREIGPQGARS